VDFYFKGSTQEITKRAYDKVLEMCAEMGRATPDIQNVDTVYIHFQDSQCLKWALFGGGIIGLGVYAKGFQTSMYNYWNQRIQIFFLLNTFLVISEAYGFKATLVNPKAVISAGVGACGGLAATIALIGVGMTNFFFSISLFPSCFFYILSRGWLMCSSCLQTNSQRT
jgi:hypothetical protein